MNQHFNTKFLIARLFTEHPEFWECSYEIAIEKIKQFYNEEVDIKVLQRLYYPLNERVIYPLEKLEYEQEKR